MDFTSFDLNTHTLFLDRSKLSNLELKTYTLNVCSMMNSARIPGSSKPSSKHGVKSKSRSLDTGPHCSPEGSLQVTVGGMTMGNEHGGNDRDGARVVATFKHSKLSHVHNRKALARRRICRSSAFALSIAFRIFVEDVMH